MECSLSEGASWYLDRLYEEYDLFDVQQTTVAVDPDEFAAIDEQREGIAVRVEITDREGVVTIPDGDEWTLPKGVVTGEPHRGRIAHLAGRQTGLHCEIDALERISLACLQCETLEDEVWTLSALFSATEVGGELSDDASRQDSLGTVISTPL